MDRAGFEPTTSKKKDKWIVLFDYFRSDIIAGPSGREVISLQKMDSQLRLVNAGEAEKLSARLHYRDLDVI